MRSLLGRGQRKNAPVPKVREATVIAVPLSFITQGGPLTLGQTEGSSVPRAPGRTSHSAPRARFQPTARPLCPGCGDATLSDPHAMHRDIPIHFIILTEPAPRVKARVFAPHRWYAAPSTPLPGPDPRRRGAASPTPRRWAVDQPGVPGMPGGTRLVTVLLTPGDPLRNHGRGAIRPPHLPRRAARLIHRAKTELTSCSFRAPRFAQRSLGACGPLWKNRNPSTIV